MYLFLIWSINYELNETIISIISVFFIKRDAESSEKSFHFSYKFTLYIHIQEQIRSFLSRSNYKILSRSHTLFLLDILVSFELRVHSIDSCSYVLKSTQTIISAASSQSTHAPPVYLLISTRLDTISFTADKWSMFSKVFSNPYNFDFFVPFETQIFYPIY